MGWLIFFIIISIGSLGVGIENFSAGKIGAGFGYMVLPALCIGFIVLVIVSGTKFERKAKNEMRNIDNEIAKWNEKKQKIQEKKLTKEEIFALLPEILQQIGYTNICEKEQYGYKCLYSTGQNEKINLFILQQAETLDFDSLADLLKIGRKAKSKKVRVFFVDEFENNVYKNLMVKCFDSMGVFIYNNKSLLSEIDMIINSLEAKKKAKQTELNPPQKKKYKKSYGPYRKIFPNMICSDDDPDYLKQIDDWEWMDDDF